MNFATYQYLMRYSAFKKGALAAYTNAIKNQYRSKEELREISWKKTKKLLEYAFDNVPWYTDKFNTIGLHPKDIDRPEHFSQVPILTREDIIKNFDRFISRKVNPKSLKISRTRGTSGKPMKIGMNRVGLREIQKWQMYSWWGINPGDHMASIYRGVPKTGLETVVLNLVNWPQKTIRVDASQINEEVIQNFVTKSKKIRPKLIHGYVGALDAVADFIIDNGIEFPPPKVIWATAAPITKVQEEKISRAFNAPVCDQYGCSEIYFIAAESPSKRGLHVFADAVNLEILDEFDDLVETGEYGRIILTNLEEYHFPLIRYENGDIGRFLKNDFPSGINLPLLDKVKGRISDNIVLPDGTVLASEFLTTIFDDLTDYVKQFQIVQKKDRSILVNVVPSHLNIDMKGIETAIHFQLQRRIRNQVRLTIRFVNAIVSDKGKLRFVIKE